MAELNNPTYSMFYGLDLISVTYFNLRLLSTVLPFLCSSF
jgi:hypothetical protein